MKRGITTANAIIVAVIVIGSIFAINLLSSFSGVEDISGDITRVSVVGGFCGNKIVKTFSGTRTDVYICPSGSSCVNSNCVAITTTPTTQKQIINIVEGFLYTTEHEEMVSVSTKTCTSSPSFSRKYFIQELLPEPSPPSRTINLPFFLHIKTLLILNFYVFSIMSCDKKKAPRITQGINFV